MSASWQPLYFGHGSYKPDSQPRALAELVNFYPRPNASQGKSAMTLYQTPGLDLWQTVEAQGYRGHVKMGSYVYVIFGQTLYRLDFSGNKVTVGNIDGVGPAHLIENGNHVGIATNVGFYAANLDGIFQVSTQVFNGASYQDGYGFFTEQGTQKLWVTNIDDMTTIGALDFTSADVLSDSVIGCLSVHREPYVFKADSIEVFYDAGALDFPFARVQSGLIERGCLGGIAKWDAPFWIGNDRYIYTAQGYQPVKISTNVIDEIIALEGDVSGARGFTYTQSGHVFYALVLEGRTLVYDITTEVWHTRKSPFVPRWRAGGIIGLPTGLVLAFDFENGNIYQVRDDIYDDNDMAVERSAISNQLNAGGGHAICEELQIEFESGAGVLSDPSAVGGSPTAWLDWSDDGGKTWGTKVASKMGELGEYGRVVSWSRLGRFKRRSFRITVNEPVKATIYGAKARVEALQ